MKSIMEKFALKEQLKRSAMLLGEKGIDNIIHSRIIVFGVGGVGSYAVEALARCGVSRLDIVDGDVVSMSNINRQIIATNSTVGLKKVDVAKKRILDISPSTEVDTYDLFYNDDTAPMIDLSKYDYIVDAIDSIDSKVLLIKEAHRVNVPVISALSTGNKLDPSKFTIDDIYNTTVCPIAKILRKRLRQEGIGSLKVVYSTELPISPDVNFADENGKKNVGSVSFVPSVAGLLMAGEVVKDLLEHKK